MRLDPDSRPLEVDQLVPVDRAVEDALRSETFLVRQRLPVVEVADRDEQHGGIAVLLQHGRGVVEVVVVAVVEGDQHGLRRQRRVAHVVIEHRFEVDDDVAELAHLVHLLVEDRDRHGQRVLG